MNDVVEPHHYVWAVQETDADLVMDSKRSDLIQDLLDHGCPSLFVNEDAAKGHAEAIMKEHENEWGQVGDDGGGHPGWNYEAIPAPDIGHIWSLKGCEFGGFFVKAFRVPVQR